MAGKSVMVTGVTGFVGKVVLEKLFFEFPDMKKIYVLVRGKPPRPPRTPRAQIAAAETPRTPSEPEMVKSATERFSNDVLTSKIWEQRVRTEGESQEAFNARVLAKVTVVFGSLGGERCSIPQKQWDELCAEVDTIIHCAASVSFDDPLHKQIPINVVGAKELIKMLQGKQSTTKPRTFVHVSTCYVGYPQGSTSTKSDGFVKEGPCEFPYDTTQLMKFITTSPPEEVISMTPALLAGKKVEQCDCNGTGFKGNGGGHQNTYTFSKAMAETTLLKMCRDDPENMPRLVILRPSCIGAALAEPCRGWIDAATANGAMYMMCSLGYLKYFPGRGEAISDQIPVDLVSNACIVAAAYAAHDDARVRAVHIGSSSSPTRVTWTESGKWICWTYAVLNWKANPKKLQLQRPSGCFFVGNR